MGADAKANTGGGGTLELGDSRLFEDGSERGGAPVSDIVVADTAGEGRSEDGEKAVVSRGPLTCLLPTSKPQPRSLKDNELGPKGGAAIAEGLKGNSTLQSLK